MRADNAKDRDAMRGSKYVQSDMGVVYELIAEDVQAKRLVLFTGTPCQCDAVKSFIGESEYLFLVDFVCHGVPSPKVFKNYLEHICDLLGGGKITRYTFRSQQYGYSHSQFGYAETANKKIYLMPGSLDLYYRAFIDNEILRDSCYQCPYTHKERVSDITIADAHNKKFHKGFKENTGVSLIYINSSKGEWLFENIKNEIVYYNQKMEDCLLPQMKSPVSKPLKYEEYWHLCIKQNGTIDVKESADIILNLKQRVVLKVYIWIMKLCNIRPSKRILEKIMGLVWR